jgi:fatty-acyl-CoA synthase
MSNPYNTDLDRNPANYQPLTPLTFLQRTASVFPQHTAIIHGALHRSYADFYNRSKQLASSLENTGIDRGHTVSVMLANTPAMLECHYGVPMSRGVLHSINTRLDPASIAFQLDHAESKIVIVDQEFMPALQSVLKIATVKPLLIQYRDNQYDDLSPSNEGVDYEAYLQQGDEHYEWRRPLDE